MSKKLNIAAAAALFSSIALGGAFAADGYQPGDGDYFNGAKPPEVSTDNESTGMAPLVVPSIDSNSTGSIATDDKDDGVNNPNASPEAGDQQYYEGVAPATK